MVTDAERLKAVSRSELMNSPPDEAYDRLTRLAVRVLNAPAAFIGIADDTHVFLKSCHSSDGAQLNVVSVPLAGTICEAIIRSGEMLIVEDFTSTPELTSGALMVKTDLASVIALPIRDSDGAVLGSFSVIDTAYRQWTQNEIEIVTELTSCVTTELELNSMLRDSIARATDIQASEARKRAILESALDCIVTIDICGNIVDFNPAAETTFGYVASQVIGEHLVDLIVPSHLRAAHRAGFDRYLSTGEAHVLGKRIEISALRANGVEFPVELAIVPIEEPVRLFTAYIRDISERRESAEQIAASQLMLTVIQNAQSHFIAEDDIDSTFSALLAHLLVLTQSSAGFIGEVLHRANGDPYLKVHATSDIIDSTGVATFGTADFTHDIEFELTNNLFATVAETGTYVLSNNARLDQASGWLPEGHPEVSCFLGMPFYQAEELLGVIGIANRQDGYTDALVEYLAPFLATCASLVSAYRVRQQRQIIQETLQIERDFKTAVFQTVGALVMVMDRTGLVLEFNPACEEIMGYSASEVVGKRIFEAPFYHEGGRDDSRLFWSNLRDDWEPEGFETRLEARSGGPRLIAWTMSTIRDIQGRISHVISCGIDITKQQENEVALIQARKNEIEIGAKIQQTLLITRAPKSICGFRIGTVSRASQGIDGDYFELFNCGLPTEHFDLLIGDVMGKGATAALLGAASKSQFQRAIRRLIVLLREFGRTPEPSEILAAVHAAMTTDLVRLESFVTLCYARFNPWTKIVTMIDCGHTRTIHFHSQTGECSFIEGKNLPLGVRLEETYLPLRVPLERGDLLVFYSDGVTEAANGAGELFGEDRLLLAVESGARLAPQELADSICEAVGAFTGKTSFTDDFTCVAVSFDAEIEPLPLLRDAREFESNLDKLDSIRSHIRDFCQLRAPAPLCDDTTDLLILAINEAITNIILHAYEGREHEWIQIIAEYHADAVIFYIHDAGKVFHPDAIPQPDFDGGRDGGFGYYIISQCMDEVYYDHYDLGRNCLTLIRKITPADLMHSQERANRYEI